MAGTQGALSLKHGTEKTHSTEQRQCRDSLCQLLCGQESWLADSDPTCTVPVRSFIYQGGRLRSIPASRSDIFKDRSLGLADKRALMSFLSACQEASKGQGPLQVRCVCACS